MSKLFVDLGSWTGDTAELFLRDRGQTEGEYVVHCFEPHPLLAGYYENRPWFLQAKAAWIYDGTISLFGHVPQKQKPDAPRVRVGSTIMRWRDNHKIDYDNPIEVPCVDFSRWLERTAAGFEHVAVKIDIESAEYEVLWKMLRDNTLTLVHELWVDFHWHDVNLPISHHQRLVEAIRTAGLEPRLLDTAAGFGPERPGNLP